MGSAGQPPGELAAHPADHLHLLGETLTGDLPGWTQGSGVQATDWSSGTAKVTGRPQGPRGARMEFRQQQDRSRPVTQPSCRLLQPLPRPGRIPVLLDGYAGTRDAEMMVGHGIGCQHQDRSAVGPLRGMKEGDGTHPTRAGRGHRPRPRADHRRPRGASVPTGRDGRTRAFGLLHLPVRGVQPAGRVRSGAHSRAAAGRGRVEADDQPDRAPGDDPPRLGQQPPGSPRGRPVSVATTFPSAPPTHPRSS
jgi:hypothetical protein